MILPHRKVSDNEIIMEIPKDWNARKIRSFTTYYEMWLQYFDIGDHEIRRVIGKSGNQEIWTTFKDGEDAVTVLLRNPLHGVDDIFNS